MSKYPTTYAERNRLANKKYFQKMTDEERRAFFRSRYYKNKEKYAERSKQWAKDNPEHQQASVHQTTVRQKYPEAWADTDITTPDLREWLKANRGNPCVYCGQEATHIEHTIPLSKGGEHRWSNLQIACKKCNLMKSDTEVQEWLKHIRLILAYTQSKELTTEVIV